MSSSDSAVISSGIEVLADDLGGACSRMQEEEGGGAMALETSRAEALHDLDKNSIGPLGLSGN